MATVTIGMPIFSGRDDEDVDRHIELFSGYLNGINVNPADVAGAPPGHARALGLFRATMQGPAAVWFDENITGKNWELQNLLQNHGQANWNALAGRTMVQLNATAGSNSFRAGTNVFAYAENVANNADTLRAYLPAHGLQEWRDVRGQHINGWTDIGGRPTDRPVQLAGGPANATVVIDLRIGGAIHFFRHNYPTVLRERRLVRFGNLAQDNDSVRDFYNKVVKYGRLLGFPDNAIEDQFFRGLSADNMLEVDRIGADRPIRDVVDALEKIEKRKAEMHLGLAKRNIQQERIDVSKAVTPVQVPPISSQEPVTMKPTSSQLTHDQINQLLKAQADNITNTFQAQIQALQEKFAQKSQPAQSSRSRPPLPPKNWEAIQRVYESANPFDDGHQYTMEEIMGTSRPSKKTRKMAEKVAQILARAEKKKMDQQIANVTNALGNLNIYDSDNDDDPMDTSNMVDGSVILQDTDGNEYTAFVTRSKKKKWVME